MPTPRVSIDELPTKATPETDDGLIIQDSGVTKKTTVAGLLTLPSAQLTAHLTDPDDAHDATAISAIDSGLGINGTTVQAQLGQLATKTDTNLATANARVMKAGDVMTGRLTAPAITVAAAPTATTDLTNKAYVDTFLPKAGGVVTGVLTTNGNIDNTTGAPWKIMTNGSTKIMIDGTMVSLTVPLVLVADPVNGYDAATKQYVDAAAVAVAAQIPPISAQVAALNDLITALTARVSDLETGT